MPDIYPGKDCMFRMDNESDWAGARDVGTSEWHSNTQSQGYVKAAANSGGNQYDCYRIFMAFDTSGISVTPSSCNLRLYGFSSITTQVTIVKVTAGATGNSSTDFVAADFDAMTGFTAGATMNGNVTTYSSATTLIVNQYVNVALNSTALSDMASLSEFKLGIVTSDFDYTNTAPNNAVTKTAGFRLVSNGTSSIRPYIAYVAGSSGYGNAVCSVDSGDIAAISSVLTANVSKVYGI